MQLSGNDLIAGLGDGRCSSLIQLSYLKVGDGCCLLDLCHTVDQLRMHFQSGNIKVLIGTKGLHTIIGILRHLFFSNGIVLQTIFLSIFLHLFILLHII